MKTLTLRLEKSLLDLLREMAKQDHRSLNSEVIHLMEQAIKQTPCPDDIGATGMVGA